MGDSELRRLRDLAPVMATISLPRGRRPLHVMPTSCGYEVRHDETYDWHGLKRGRTPFTILQHTVRGAGHLAYEHKRYRLEAGDTMLLVVPHNHRYWLAPGDTWEFVWLSTTGQEAVALQRDIQAATGPVVRLASPIVERIAGCCLRLIEDDVKTPGAVSAIAYEAVMTLYDALLFPNPALQPDAADPVSRVVRLIRAELGGPLDVARLAAAAGLSRTQFSRVFTARQGLPPAEFVMRERMTEAARLLGQQALPVKAVAAACGFADPNHFAKAFRRMFGVSPTDFRTTGMYSAGRTLAGP